MGRAWKELNMDNLRHNCEVICKLLPENCQLMPALKANAYGHGAVEVARELNAMGLSAFCVATLHEGVELRKNGIKGEILILGYTHPNEFYLLRKHRLTQTVLDSEYAKAINSYRHKIHVHIGIDTGMHRLGECSENIDNILEMFKCENLVVDGMFTHLCASDSMEKPFAEYTNAQILLFYGVVNEIKAQGIKCPKLHIQSSYGVMNYPELKCDYARVGIALYGLMSTQEDTEKCNLALRPVLSVKSRVSAVKNLAAGEFAGYGMEFEAPCDMKIAVLSIGYADGIPRSLSCGKGSVLIAGKKAPIIGRICMDQMSVDVTDIPFIRQNDIADIIGKSGNDVITAGDIAKQAGTISNEILSRLGGRLSLACKNKKNKYWTKLIYSVRIKIGAIL
ncbi:MAG: alanine racemase [Firmicutes bacterium HGW-Firmicutes-16]|nr:MAG: alanine racemase [Firmicutes bacterium HGW-Firmicutes-16]